MKAALQVVGWLACILRCYVRAAYSRHSEHPQPLFFPTTYSPEQKAFKRVPATTHIMTQMS